jgi:hypothetical protein
MLTSILSVKLFGCCSFFYTDDAHSVVYITFVLWFQCTTKTQPCLFFMFVMYTPNFWRLFCCVVFVIFCHLVWFTLMTHNFVTCWSVVDDTELIIMIIVQWICRVCTNYTCFFSLFGTLYYKTIPSLYGYWIFLLQT